MNCFLSAEASSRHDHSPVVEHRTAVIVVNWVQSAGDGRKVNVRKAESELRRMVVETQTLDLSSGDWQTRSKSGSRGLELRTNGNYGKKPRPAGGSCRPKADGLEGITDSFGSNFLRRLYSWCAPKQLSSNASLSRLSRLSLPASNSKSGIVVIPWTLVLS